jgi:hypothetical protein
MADPIPFGSNVRTPAPARWGCLNLEASPILADPCVVEHHYLPGGEMPGFVKVGGDTAELRASQAVIWPAGQTHKLWTTDASMTVLLIHFPGRDMLIPAPEEWRNPAPA